ncbi:glutamine amidotransferase [Massilia eurypsychrophila]|jgi:putative intracellular protease/amidase|uniref:Glutamine amidotransferase n=1 Tax=Massilia eurypsychrophila TaxID=1485217 RepID=A0A2G8TBQ0_9BURK|nr:DJ-1/PfpI family protein [Massilia eurypsychrophila]PIL43108.1 glutamine amidotransferase [Massilia eurypsychrophila]
MRLTILLFDGFTALDVVGGYEVLANVPGMEVEFAAAVPGVVTADTGRLGMLAYRSFDQLETTDMLYVPGGPGVSAALDHRALLDCIRRLDAASQWTVSICNGAELLGAAGLLEGKRVTTNWFARDKVAAYGALIEPARCHRDGKLVTAAGVSASIDAALFLAGLLAGEATARLIQFGIEYYPDPPFGNGSPDTEPEAAKSVLRRIEQAALERLAARDIPF